MKVSKDQVAENRRNVLQSAARLFRERGLDAVTLDDVMKEAGLTRGAFYGHFKSKNDLVAQAMAYAVKPTEGLENQTFADYVASYLSASHRDDRAEGCAFASLASEVTRQPQAARHEMTEGLKQTINLMTANAPGSTPSGRRLAAIAAISSIMGGLILARMSDDPAFSDEILDANVRALVD
jgi:TetR/AcrR family transcriptional repressor of nem operon